MRNRDGTYNWTFARAEAAALLAFPLLAMVGCCGIIPSQRFHPASIADHRVVSEQAVTQPAGQPACGGLHGPKHGCGGTPVARGQELASGGPQSAAPTLQPPHSKFHPVPTRPVFAPLVESPLPQARLAPTQAGSPDGQLKTPMGVQELGSPASPQQPAEAIDPPPALPRPPSKTPAAESPAARRSPSGLPPSGSETVPDTLDRSDFEVRQEREMGDLAAPSRSAGPTRSAVNSPMSR